jgi:putative tryptophan/tyrosine transport system substrate-binding protein
MRRREFIGLVGSAAVSAPFVAHAQQAALPIIGILHPGSPETSAEFITGFRTGLSEMGFAEGQNVTLDYRWAYTRFDRLPELAADLINRRVKMLAVSGPLAAQAAKEKTTTIPIIFALGADPIELGLVASLNRPGGNVTGITSLNTELVPKRLGLLRELIPTATRFAMLVNPDSPNAARQATEVRTAASASGREIEILAARTAGDIDAAFTNLVQNQANALVVGADPLFIDRRVHLISLTMRNAVPAIYPSRQFPDIGGLMSYGTSATGLNRELGVYAGRILKGDKPSDLPVMQATKFELVVNSYTAKLLGIMLPHSLLAQADEVIE